MRIGVLALQGAFREHSQVLASLDADPVPVRRTGDLCRIDGIVIPGGESTTIRLLMEEYGLTSELRGRIAEGMPVMGTCAGMIVLAYRVNHEPAAGLGALAIDVRRNAFGRQVDSFEVDLAVPVLGDEPFRAVFIRAPLVESVEDGVKVLARLTDGTVVAVQQGTALGLAFHPELTGDDRFHRYFLSLVGAGEPIASTSG